MSAEQTPTPEGWERRGPCFIREHGGKLAVVQFDAEDCDWLPHIYDIGEFIFDGSHESLADAIAWANDQLGVPKPVVVHEREFSDGWLLWCDETGRSFRVSKNIQCRDYVDLATAMEKGREYVRGVQ